MTKNSLKSLEKELTKKVKQKQELHKKVEEQIKLEKEQELQKQEKEKEEYPKKLELAKKLFEWKKEFQKTKQFKQIFETLELPWVNISSHTKPNHTTYNLFLANNENCDEEKQLATYKSNQTIEQKIEFYYGSGTIGYGCGGIDPTDKLKKPENAAKELPLELLEQTIGEIVNNQIYKNIEENIQEQTE